MAKPYNYVRLSLYGVIASTQSWSCNLGIKPSAVDIDNAALAAWLTSIDTPLQAWWNAVAGVKTLNSTDVSYIGARAESYPAGATKAEAAADHPFSSALAGSVSGFGPTQGCLVVSLLTTLGGRHNRGRIYVPATGASFTTGHKVTSAGVDAAVNSTATLITALNASSIDTLSVSTVVAGSINPPAAVTTCRGDNEMDIQRRRADKILPSYFKTANV